MKTRNKLYTIFILLVFATSCKKEAFVEANLSPSTVYEVTPGDQFLAAASGSQDDFEYYYDVYRSINFWMQYATNFGTTGNSLNFTNPGNLITGMVKYFMKELGPGLLMGSR